ncbi:MAG: hypothetical protein H6625_11900 [Bdellovibrionaceae bacterium]|nr:hypothetical protein [Pseudobdellovibrionaceae bacterium]
MGFIGFSLRIIMRRIPLILLLTSCQAVAQKAQVTKPIIEASKVKEKDQKITVKIEQNFFYISKPEGKDFFKKRSMSKLGFSYQGQNKSKSLTGDIEYFYSEGENQHYFNLRQAFYTLSTQNVNIYVGRKKHRWNQAEEYWNMGQWQPRFMWSRLRPEENGLSGVFFQRETSQISWMLFASPIYIPEFGPQFHFENNEFDSANPWFQDPAPRATVPGLFESKKVLYNLYPPSVGEVLQQKSFAMQVRWHKNPYYCQASFAYKPMNQVLLSVDPVIRIDVEGAPPGVDVYPFVNEHRLVSGECGSESSQGWFGFISFSHENHIDKPHTERWVTKRFLDTSTATSLVGFKNLRSQFYISLMGLWGGDDLDSGEKASLTDSFFENRYEFYQAIQLGHSRHGRWLSKPMTWGFKFIWDIQQQAWLWVSDWAVDFKSNIKVFIQADGLAVSKGSEVGNENSFFHIYKRNDQVSAGVKIAF